MEILVELGNPIRVVVTGEDPLAVAIVANVVKAVLKSGGVKALIQRTRTKTPPSR